ncbi:Atu4866 domain-containing protein [Streptomyces sp. NPDC016640]|uniref:Atu4866 domain-containing protein n=1 Tax=Streptomyces sp. NPDC016640 TaxID=3364969 RepID=UPI0036FEA5F6
MTSNDTSRGAHAYVGMRVTADGFIRQEPLPDGRYDEARGNHRSTCAGRCTVTGSHRDHVDDTGSTAIGDVPDGLLLHKFHEFHEFHEHLVPHREGDPRARQGGPRPGP